MKVVNGREIPDIAGELTNQEGMNMLADVLTECANAFSETVDGDTLALSSLSTAAATITGNATVGGTLGVTGALTATAAIKTGANNGAANGTGVVATEYGDGTIHQTVLALTAHSVSINGAAVGFGTSKIYDFPEGAVCVLGAVANLAITAGAGGIADNFDGDFSLGTVGTADANVSDAGEANIIASTATPQASAGVSSAKGQSTATECPLYLDGTSTAADLYLNFLIDDADISSNDTLACTGTVTITWVKLGDY